MQAGDLIIWLNIKIFFPITAHNIVFVFYTTAIVILPFIYLMLLLWNIHKSGQF